MLDVHPPHHAAHTARDFLIHIATITVGLLIAVGLEQTVEYFHHRRQVAEAHEALRRELEDNVKRFELSSRNTEYTVPALRGDLATFVFLREHPRAPAGTWTFPIRGGVTNVLYAQGAWRAIQQSGVIEHLSQAEISRYDRMYARLSILNDLETRKRGAMYEVHMAFAAQPDASKMTPEEIEQEIHALEMMLSLCAEAATSQRSLSNYTPAFSNPPADEFALQGMLLHWPGAVTTDPEFKASIAAYTAIEERQEQEFSRSTKGDR